MAGQTMIQNILPGFELTHYPRRVPAPLPSCPVCQQPSRLYRCDGCFKRVCGTCGGENPDGDWFCDACWSADKREE
jgi:hypothetical protein